MTFAKTYREEITLAYYCFNFALTFAIFTFGTIYLRHRDRRDQRRKEWRQFAENIRSEYSKLKTKNIPSKVSKVKDTFGNIQIYKEITGIDVLRFMISGADRESFKTTQLDALREDLDSIFQLLNACASLILLGTVPNNIRVELRKLVTELGELTLPFYKGEERAVILRCLEHFGSGGRPKDETERRLTRIDAKLKRDVPYIQCLRFDGQNLCEFMYDYGGLNRTDREYLINNHDYSTCSKFTLKVSLQNRTETLGFLKQLHDNLEEEKYTSEFARELREHLRNLLYNENIDSDSDEMVLVKVMHEVRVYIHHFLPERNALDGEIQQEEQEINENLEILRDVHERVTRIRPDEDIIRYTCDRFISDLLFLKENMQPFHKSERFRLQLQGLYETFCDIIITRGNNVPSLPPSTGTENYQYVSCV